MTGTPGNLQPMPYGPVISNQIQLSPNYGTLSAYFNRGILATQATALVLNNGTPAGSIVSALEKHIDKPGDALRLDLAGQMIEALTTLSDDASSNGGDVYCALYEFEDPELIAHLASLKGKAHVIFSNMPGTTADKQKTNDTYALERKQIHDAAPKSSTASCPAAISRQTTAGRMSIFHPTIRSNRLNSHSGSAPRQRQTR